jgi:hypothetical protein
MSSPSVNCIISAEDRASSVLRAVAQLSEKVAKDLEKTGRTNALGALPGHYDAATRAAEKHLSVLHQMGAAFKTLAASAAAYAAYKFPHIAAEAVKEYLPIEREQIAMQAAGHYSDADMTLLRKQQTDLAQKYGETPESVVHAQAEYVKRHMDAATAAAMTEEGVKLAKAIGTTAQRGAQILEGMIFGTGQHVTNPEDARRLGKRFADIAAVQNKQGAMSPEDIEGGWKYAAAATTAAHITPEQVAATQMVLKREQFSGDESGIFWRQLGARLMQPTAEGRTALQAAGIKYDQFVSPGKMNAGNFNLTLAEAGLKELPENEIAKIKTQAEAGAFKMKADFARAIRDAYERAYDDTSAKDLKVIGGKAGHFFEASKGQVDGAKLWDEMLHKLTPQQILEYLGVKQGAKGVSAIQQVQVGKEYEDLLKNASGTADRIANERMQGLAAAIDRMTASYDDVKNQFVEANKPVLTNLANLGATLTGFLAGLDSAEKQTMTYAAAIGSLAGGAFGLKAAFDLSKKVLEAVSGKTPTGEATKAAAEAAGAVAGGTGALPGAAIGGGVLAGVGGSAFLAGHILDTQHASEPGHRPWSAGRLWDNFTSGGDTPVTSAGINASVEAAVHAAEMKKLAERLQYPEPRKAPEFAAPLPANNGLFDVRPILNKIGGDPASGGGLMALLGAVEKINAKPVDVQVQGDVKGEALMSVRIDPSPLFTTQMNEVKSIALLGKLNNLGKSVSGPTGVTK